MKAARIIKLKNEAENRILTLKKNFVNQMSDKDFEWKEDEQKEACFTSNNGSLYYKFQVIIKSRDQNKSSLMEILRRKYKWENSIEELIEDKDKNEYYVYLPAEFFFNNNKNRFIIFFLFMLIVSSLIVIIFFSLKIFEQLK